MSSAKNTTLTLHFEPERETKGTWRFAEQHADTDEPMVGTLYIRKSALAKLGNPDRLKVTVTADDGS